MFKFSAEKPRNAPFDGASRDCGMSFYERYASDPLQLLFGQYRDWGNIRTIHFVLFGTALGATIVMYAYYAFWRYSHLLAAERRFPDLSWVRRVWYDVAPLLLEYRIGLFVAEEVRRNTLVPENVGAGDLGWSLVKARDPIAYCRSTHRVGLLNFKRIIAESHALIECLVTPRLPYLRLDAHRTLRDYMARVADNFTIDRVVLAEYMEYYEAARFGAVRFTAHDFAQFMQCVTEIMAALREGWKETAALRRFHGIRRQNVALLHGPKPFLRIVSRLSPGIDGGVKRWAGEAKQGTAVRDRYDSTSQINK